MKVLTLEGVVDRVAIATERLRVFCPPEGYHLAFSGGKDSMVVYDLALRAGVPFDAHFYLTTVDPPEVLRFVRQYYPAVKWERPETTMFKAVRSHGLPPTRLLRYCCSLFKECHGAGRVVVTGVRREESLRRRNRQVVEPCVKGHGKTFLHPILDWSEQDVWQYIRERHLPYCSLYDEGRKRIGCVMCPNAAAGMKIDAKRWPRIAENYRRACHAAVEERRRKGLATDGDFADGDRLYAWWLAGGGDNRVPEGQEVLAFE